MNLLETQNNKTNNFQNFIDGTKKVGETVGGVLTAVIFAVAHPIIGPLGSLGCLFSAAYHGLALNYHWRHTREKDESGNYIDGTSLINQATKNPYSNSNPGYTQKDLPRLEHEKERLYHQNAAADSLKWARGLAKCTIPIVGPFWALISELSAGGSVAMCDEEQQRMTGEQKLELHISNLKN